MRIELNIEKKHFWITLSTIVIMTMAILVYAYGTSGTSAPATFGHSAGEVDVDIDGQAKTLQQAITDGDFDSVDTDTKCDASGNCAQVCVGSQCFSTWPVCTVDTNNCVGITEGALANPGCPAERPVLNRVSVVCGEGGCSGGTGSASCCALTCGAYTNLQDLGSLVDGDLTVTGNLDVGGTLTSAGTPCTWSGDRAVSGNMGGCIDDIIITCTNGIVTNMRFSC